MRVYTARYLERYIKYIHYNFTLLVDIKFLNISIYFKPSSAISYNVVYKIQCRDPDATYVRQKRAGY